jgi:hypothetical protein
MSSSGRRTRIPPSSRPNRTRQHKSDRDVKPVEAQRAVAVAIAGREVPHKTKAIATRCTASAQTASLPSRGEVALQHECRPRFPCGSRPHAGRNPTQTGVCSATLAAPVSSRPWPPQVGRCVSLQPDLKERNGDITMLRRSYFGARVTRTEDAKAGQSQQLGLSRCRRVHGRGCRLRVVAQAEQHDGLAR